MKKGLAVVIGILAVLFIGFYLFNDFSASRGNPQAEGTPDGSARKEKNAVLERLHRGRIHP